MISRVSRHGSRGGLYLPPSPPVEARMADFPIVPSKTAMLFFDTLNVYLHPEDPTRQAAIDTEGAIPRLLKLNKACRAAGITIFYGQADHRPDGRDFAPQIVGLGYDGTVGEGPRLTV